MLYSPDLSRSQELLNSGRSLASDHHSHPVISDTTSVTASVTPETSTVGETSMSGFTLTLSAPGLLQLVGLKDEPMHPESSRPLSSRAGAGSGTRATIVGEISIVGSTLTLSAPGLLQFVGLNEEPRQRSPSSSLGPALASGRASAVVAATR